MSAGVNDTSVSSVSSVSSVLRRGSRSWCIVKLMWNCSKRVCGLQKRSSWRGCWCIWWLFVCWRRNIDSSMCFNRGGNISRPQDVSEEPVTVRTWSIKYRMWAEFWEDESGGDGLEEIKSRETQLESGVSLTSRWTDASSSSCWLTVSLDSVGVCRPEYPHALLNCVSPAE